MLKLSEILTKKVISLQNAKIIGTLTQVIFDEKIKSPLFLVVTNDDKTIYLPFNCIAHAQSDAITIKFTQDCKLTSPYTQPLNMDSYSIEGKYIGKVDDIIMEKESVKEIIVNETKLYPNKIICLSNDVLIFNTSDKPYKPYKKKTDKNIIKPTTNVSVPTKVTSHEESYNFLLDKKVTKNIMADNGEILIYENTIVTRDIVYLAKQNNKLVQLALHSI